MVHAMREWSTPRIGLKVFVSSTFTDSQLERNLLLDTLLPELREECRALNLEDLSLYDMRFGVQDANTLRHLTWVMCAGALERCYNESGGLFFLSLQGDKYGYRPLPLVVDKAVMETSLARHCNDAPLIAAGTKWYKLDTNVAGGAYVLEDLDAINDPDWEAHVEELCLLANNGAIIPSATSEEEAALASGAIGPRRNYWYSRMPRVIDKAAFESLKAGCSKAVQAVAMIWYIDTGQQAPCVRLRGLVEILHNDYWSVMGALRSKLLSGVAFETVNGQKLLVDASVTEWETRYALALPGAVERSHWMHRRFDGSVTEEQDPKKLLDDGSDRLAPLKEHMRAVLGPARIDEFAVTADSYLAQDAAWAAHLHAFETRVRVLFAAEFARLAEQQRQWAADGCGEGMPGVELAEVLHHVQWACDKVSDFEGRERELAEAEERVARWMKENDEGEEGEDGGKDGKEGKEGMEGGKEAEEKNGEVEDVEAEEDWADVIIDDEEEEDEEEDQDPAWQRNDAEGRSPMEQRNEAQDDEDDGEEDDDDEEEEEDPMGQRNIDEYEDDDDDEEEGEENNVGAESNPMGQRNVVEEEDNEEEEEEEEEDDDEEEEDQDPAWQRNDPEGSSPMGQRNEAQEGVDENDGEEDDEDEDDGEEDEEEDEEEEQDPMGQRNEAQEGVDENDGEEDDEDEDDGEEDEEEDEEEEQDPMGQRNEEEEQDQRNVEGGQEGGGEDGEEEAMGNDNERSGLSGVSLCVVGKSGAGKTAFIAKLAQRLSQERPDRPVLVRFCGTSRGSMSGLALVQSLCAQMRHVFRRASVITPTSSGYEEWVAHLHAMLHEHALTLLIDSLDQLSNEDEARSQLSFLQGVVPHSDTRIVVSCLPDETDALTGKRYFYGCDTRLREGGVPRVLIEPLEEGDALGMMRQLLARQGRGLTSEQWGVVSASTAGKATTALYCRLAVRVVGVWKSSSSECVLPPTAPELIDFLLEGIEAEFGSEWTRVALALITYSRAGVSDGEMQDLLSLDDERVLNHVFQYSKPDGVRRFPLHVWLRLRGALEGLLVEREHGCCQWYHRQLRDAAETRYAVIEKEKAHELLACYFGDLAGDRGRERLVARQPLTLDGASVWMPGARVNRRRCVEAPFHLSITRNARELCSVELVCACTKAGQGFELLRALLSFSVHERGEAERLTHYKRWLLNDMSLMQADPQNHVIGACLANEPLNSWARLDLEAVLRQTACGASSLMDLRPEKFRQAWIRGRCLGGKQSFDACVMTLQGHTGGVRAVAWSLDGLRIASGSVDGSVRVWDGESGQCMMTMKGSTGVATAVAWNPDGRHLVSGSYDTFVRVWDTETGQCAATLEGHIDPVWDVTWSPNGRFLASASSDKNVCVWDAVAGKCLATLEGHNNRVHAVAWSPDGRRIASASSDKTVRVWDAESGECVATLLGSSESLGGWFSVAWSPEGCWLAACSGDISVRLWDAASWVCVSTLHGHTKEVYKVAWSRDGGRIATCSRDNSVRFWDAEAGQCLGVFEGHTKIANSVAWSHDGRRFASGSADKTVRVWEADATRCIPTMCGHTSDVTAVAWSPDGKQVASGSKDRCVRVWSLELGLPVATLQRHTECITAVAWSSDGRRIASSALDRHVLVWDVGTRKCIATLKENTHYAVNDIDWSPGGEFIVSASDDKRLRIWDTESGQCMALLEGHTRGVFGVSWSPDGILIASSAGDKSVRIWGAKTFQQVATLEEHTGDVNAVAWNPKGRFLASASRDLTVRVWDAESNTCVGVLEGHIDRVTCVAWSPNGRRIVSGSGFFDKSVRVWEVESGQCVSILQGHTSLVQVVAWSPDGHCIASGSRDSSVRLWDAALDL